MRRLLTRAALVAATCATAAPLPAQVGPLPPSRPPAGVRDADQTSETGTATLTGRVLGPDGMPLRRARVEMFGVRARWPRSTSTDADGRYRFEALPSGDYYITASKTGYVTLQYGQRRPYEQAKQLTLANDQQAERVDFSLPRGSVVAVRITDELGEPLAGVSLHAHRYEYTPDGQRRLARAASSATLGEVTDDRGELRLYGLMPGDYVIQATMGRALAPSIETREGFSPTYFPGTVSPDQAQMVRLGIDDEQSIQMSMQTETLARVAGTVVDVEGRPVGGAHLSLMTVRGPGSMDQAASTQTASDGTFAFNGVAPGQHVVNASLSMASRPQRASMPIAVGGGDLTGLQLALGPGATISGRVTFDGTARRTGGPFRVMAQPVDPMRFSTITTHADDNGDVDEAGAFRLAGVVGPVIVHVVAPAPWSVRSITARGEDITTSPLDVNAGDVLSGIRIVMTDRITGVAGQVTDGRGRATDDAIAVVVPARPVAEPAFNAMFARAGRPDAQGRFSFTLRPGTYVAVAVEALEGGRQYSPEFQAEVRQRGREFTLREGDSLTLNLQVSPEF